MYFTKVQIRLWRPIMQATKSFIQGHIAFTEIHIVIPVMQVVHVTIVSHGFFIAEHNLIEACVTDSRPQACLEGVEHHM